MKYHSIFWQRQARSRGWKGPAGCEIPRARKLRKSSYFWVQRETYELPNLSQEHFYALTWNFPNKILLTCLVCSNWTMIHYRKCYWPTQAWNGNEEAMCHTRPADFFSSAEYSMWNVLFMNSTAPNGYYNLLIKLRLHSDWKGSMRKVGCIRNEGLADTTHFGW